MMCLNMLYMFSPSFRVFVSHSLLSHVLQAGVSYLTFASKAGACSSVDLLGTPLLGKLLALPTKFRPGWIDPPITNTSLL